MRDGAKRDNARGGMTLRMRGTDDVRDAGTVLRLQGYVCVNKNARHEHVVYVRIINDTRSLLGIGGEGSAKNDLGMCTRRKHATQMMAD